MAILPHSAWQGWDALPDMKVVILAGGLGSRLAEETGSRPKPLVEIGGRPILWHIMKIYGHYGFTEFIVCLGYKGYMIKEFFNNYFLHLSDVTFDLAHNSIEIHKKLTDPWRVTLVETGEQTQTGGRLKRVLPYVMSEDFFAMTYGDGVADIDLHAEILFHRRHERLATLAAVRPAKRFGVVSLDGDRVTEFAEKPDQEGGWINGGFFLLSPKVGDLIEDDSTVWEQEPLRRLAQEDQLRAFQHTGFWHPMDSLRDRNFLEGAWASGEAKWKIWR